MSAVRYLSEGEMIAIHTRVAANAAVRSQSLLGSAVGRPQGSFGGTEIHADLYEKASALMLGVLMNHPFTDGNKRTAWLSAMIFLSMNGQEFPRIENDRAIAVIISAIENKDDVSTVAQKLRDLTVSE